MKFFRIFSSGLIAATLSVATPAAFAAAAEADDDASATASDTSSIKFSDPSKPGTVKLSVANGDIRIRGSDAAIVTVQSEVKAESHEPRKDGLRVLSSSSSYSLVEKNNVVTLNYGSGGFPGSGGDFTLTVPHNTNIVIANAFGGDIDIRGVTGDLEIKSLNGEVTLEDVSSGALVETMNGEITVKVRQIQESKPLSFTSMNGQVQLYVPVDAKANVRLRTHNGSIMTDFDDKQLVTKTASLRPESGHRGNDAADIRSTVRDAVRVGVEAAREATRAAQDAIREAHRNGEVAPDIEIPTPPMPPLPPMTGGKIVTGVLNGGGPEIRVTTMNGEVLLRKIDASKS